MCIVGFYPLSVLRKGMIFLAERKKVSHRRKRRKKLHLSAFIFKCILVLLALSVIAGAAVCIFTEPIDATLLSMKMSSVIYYENDQGEKVIVQNLYSDENRTWVDFEKIPLNMKNAFIAIEDERFYSHPGFDLKRLGGAVINTGLRIFDKNRPVYGGSTITQQLVKNLTGEDERSFLRKAKEIYRAFRLEKDMSKNDILELYLNSIYLSQNCNGVGAASRTYFAKEVSELSLAECASIAGITQYPSLYDPYRNPEANKEKQLLVLGKMLELGMISEEEYVDAKDEELTFARAEGHSNTYYSYFVDTVIEEVMNDLTGEYNYTQTMAESMLYTGGLQIKCTIDPQIQAVLEKVYTSEENYIKKGDEMMQSAMVVTEASTGEIKGIVGGMGEKSGSRTFNRATALRQPGSSIKPIAVYAPAIENGVINEATVIDDFETTFIIDGGTEWTPRNSGNSFLGPVSLRTAVAKSLNIPAAKVLEETGINTSYNFLTQKLGITSLVEKRQTAEGIVSDKALAALSLGGLTDGVSPIEMASAYAPFINNGYYITPHTYTEIYDFNGELLFRKRPETHRAMKDSTATIVTDLLTSVVKEGTGTSAYFPGPELAGKTGTTTNNHDKWFVGYTPSLVAATWVGYDNPSAINSYGNPAARLWQAVMSKIDYSKRPKSFSRVLSYEGLEEYHICSVSGLLARDFCIEADTVYSVLLDDKSYRALDECEEDAHFEELPDEEIIPPEGDLPPQDVIPDVPENDSDASNTAPSVTEL